MKAVTVGSLKATAGRSSGCGGPVRRVVRWLLDHPADRPPVARPSGRHYALPMPRTSAFADVDDGPPADAVVVPLGGPTRAALGCFGLTTVFLALVAAAAVSYAISGVPGPVGAPPSLRVVAGVLGGLFLVMVVGLAVVAVRATRRGRGLAFAADGVWCRPERVVVLLPWSDVAAVRVVPPVVVRGVRTSTPRTPSVEVTPTDDAAARRYPALADSVTSGEPAAPGLATLRFTFRLSSTDDTATVTAAIARFAPNTWLE